MRDEIQIILPKNEKDMFSEELKVNIQNIQVSNHQQRIEIKVMSEDLMELSKLEMNGERVLLITANRNFFALYTNRQNLHLFSSSTTELIKRGILLEGVCMITSNATNNRIAMVTLKGLLHVYQVVNPDIQSMDCVKPLFTNNL
jgi:hypothetical protein